MPYSGSIQIVNDANGTAYGFLADDGLVWQCIWNAEAERWDKGQVVPGAEGGRELQALVVEDLWPTQEVGTDQWVYGPGVVLAYRVGNGANSRVVASLGAWGSDGSLSWSEAVSLSNEQGNDEAFALVRKAPSQASPAPLQVVVQKRESEASAADLLLRLQEAPSELLSEELDKLASGLRPDSDLYLTDVQVVVDPTSGGFALKLDGNGVTSSATLTPAVAPAVVAQPALPFAGNTQLSRSALTANVVAPSHTPSLAQIGLASNAVGVAAPAASGNSGVPGLGFTRYVKNPKSLASLGLFPVRYQYSSAITRQGNAVGPVNDSSPTVDYYYRGGTSGSQSDFDEELDVSHNLAKTSLLELFGSPIENELGGSVRYVVDASNALEAERLINGADYTGKKGTDIGSGWVLSGLFGGLLAGRGGYSVANFTTLKFEQGAQSNKLGDQAAGGKTVGVLGIGGRLDTRNRGWGVGGSLKTLFQYSGSSFDQTLTNYTAQESFGAYYLRNTSKIKLQGSRVFTDLSLSISLLAEERFNSSDGLPRVLADIGLATGAAGDVLSFAESFYAGVTTAYYNYHNDADVLSGSTSISNINNNGLGISTRGGLQRYAQLIGLLSTALSIGSTVGVLASQMRNNGSFSMGVGAQEALELKYLSKYGVGLSALLGSQQNVLWTFGDGWVPDFQALIFASAGVASIGGGYIPLFNGSYLYNTKPQTDTGAALGSTAALEETTTTQPTSEGSVSLAPTGADYPFGYAPASANDSLLNNNSPLASLLSTRSPLFRFSIQSFNAANLSDEVLQWPTNGLGAGLNDGDYSNVPLIGLTLPGSSAALASFTVSNGSIDPTSLQVSVSERAGQYLGLPSPASGYYSFGLDVFTQVPGNPLPPDATKVSSLFEAMPVFNLALASDQPESPLEATNLLRIQQQVAIAGLSQSGPYPLPDGSMPAVNDASIYTYSAVPVQVQTGTGDSVSLLNPDTTATVKLSGGQIIAITLDEDLYFNQQAGSSYTLVIDLQSRLGAAVTNPQVVVSSQSFSLNDFSEQDSFSANSAVKGAGVFLATGPSDQLGLLPSFGAFPLQNRVSYIDGSNVVYLNNTAGASSDWGPVYPSDVSLEDLKKDPTQYQFSNASSPTAITDRSSNTTYVFWVEASEPVIPLTGSNGEENFQQFMDAYWGNQRINYSYAKTSDANTNIKWNYLTEDSIYAPAGSIITDLRSFTVELNGELRSLLVWVEVPIDELKQALSNPEQVISSQIAVIKTGLINSDSANTAGGYQWNSLFDDADGNTTIREVPWSAAYDSGLSITDLSAANLTVEVNDQAQLTPVLSWSQGVRTPYNEAVLDSNPTLFIPFADLQPGFNTLTLANTGQVNTETFASSTGLSTAVRGPLTKSTATAVLNEQGLGVLATGLGSFNAPLLDIARNAPQTSTQPVVAVFEGSITDFTLTVTSLTQGELKKGDLLVGDGVTANTKILEVVTPATASTGGTYRLDQSSAIAADTTLRTLPSDSQVALSTFTGSFSGSGGTDGYTTLTISGLSGFIGVGDRVLGLGIAGGVTVQKVVSRDPDSDTATVIVDQGPAVSGGTYGLASIPGGTSSPYTIEFWTKLSRESNPAGAGLVGLGQASSTALPGRPVEVPDGWLLSSGFAVERLTWQDALNQSLVSALPNGEAASDLYGWRWGLVATGTNTTAMAGNGGSNISRNALVLANLSVGDKIDGVNTFLVNYGLTASDLTGIDGAPADQIASAPSTEFNFVTDLAFNTLVQADVATTSLDGVAVVTDSALMNAGFLSAADAQANASLSKMLETLWTFQQETGEVKVNFDLNPEAENTSPTTPPQTPDPSTPENYAGYALEFALTPGPAVSINGNGQIAYDVAEGITLLSNAAADYRDDQWHYVAVSFLPDFNPVDVDNTLFEVPTNVGTANLYVDGVLVASQDNVIDPYAPVNLNDNAQLLAENAGGAIDLLAFYNTALTTLQTPATADGWPLPTSTDALELMQEAGYVFEGLTPHRGEQPGAISNHYLAHTVDPNDALEATFTSVLLPDQSGGYSWSEASTLNPQLELSPTATSASNQNLDDALLIPISAGDWQKAGWFSGTSEDAARFNPVNRELQSITVVLTPTGSTTGETITRVLTPGEVLLGSTGGGNIASLEAVQPFSTNNDSSLDYTFLSSQPALNLQISKAADSKGDSGTLNSTETYQAQVTLTFNDGTVVSNVSSSGTNGLALGFTPSIGSSLASTVLNANTALTTAQEIEQAPIQLKYIDSGVQLSSKVSPADPSPASTFGASQVYGSFTDPVNSGLTAGWIALAQPRSSNASSDPAGRIWIQYAGSFAIDANKQPEQVLPGVAPTTWLNALSTSTFSPDQPNLPLLNNAFNPSQVGGLLIKADPTDGWGQNLGSNMLVADVNNDGVDDLVLSAPQANDGGSVIIIDGQWIKSSLTQTTGETILDLSNPDSLGEYVTILSPGVVNEQTDLITVAGFGSALGFVPGSDGEPGQLLIGAPNYLRTLDSSDELTSTQPVGALYSYQYSSTETSWGAGVATPVSALFVGVGGTLTVTQAGDGTTTDYWGAKLGTSIAISDDGQIAVSSPGVMGAMIYSGTEIATERVDDFKINANSSTPQGLLTHVQVGDSAIDTTQGLKNPDLKPVISHQNLSDPQIQFLNQVRDLQNAHVADATTLNNQAIQYGAFGAVSHFNSVSDLQALSSGLETQDSTDFAITPTALATVGGKTFYGPNLFNTLGDSGFGSSLTFADLTNSNVQQLVVGADQSAGGGQVYVLDPQFASVNASLGSRQFLASDAATNMFSAAAAGDYLGSGLISLGDVNQDGYDDVLMQAYNADSSAGSAYLLFGSDQLATSVTNSGVASLASGSIDTIALMDGSSTSIAILSELGEAGSLAGQGNYGAGDYNADGYADVPLGSGNLGEAYITYGHPYLEAISNLQLNRLASNTGFMLDGLATTTQGSLRSIGDFNGDGYGDFMSINPGPVATTVRIELGANTQEILAEAPYNDYTFTVSLDTEVLPAGDVNGDGLDDIALFIDKNLASQAEGNFGAGSTTGLLFGRSSDALPVGSSFGFLSPVSAESEPVMPLPALPVAGGLTDVAPAFIAAGSTIYAAVKGNGADDTSIWFTQSTDSGSTWANWVDLSSTVEGLSTLKTPSLALFNNTLYLGIATPSGEIAYSSWDPASADLTAWSQTQLLAGTNTTLAPQLMDRGDSLGVIWVDDGLLKASSSTDPVSANVDWTTPVQLRTSAGANIASSSAPSFTWLGTTPVLAVGNTGVIEVYAGFGSGSSLQLVSTFEPAQGQTITSAPVITTTDTGLALSYTNADSSVNLSRLDLLSTNGEVLPGVVIDTNGVISLNTGDLTWSTTTFNATNSGIETNLATSPLSVNGNLMLANIRSDAQYADQIWINLIPNLEDTASNPWNNSTIQLPDPDGGWLISQSSDGNPISTLVPVGDLNGDGFDDLAVSNPSLAVAGKSSILLNSGWSTLQTANHSTGSSPSTAAMAQVGETLYIAVQGNEGDRKGNPIFWSSSTDQGKTWGNWQNLPNGMTSLAAPSLAAYNGTLYLSYLGSGNNEINITSLSDPSSNNWTSQYQIPWSGGTQSALSATLLTEIVNDSEYLSVYYVSNNESQSELLRTSSNNPTTASSWSEQTSIEYNNGSTPQTASGPLAVTSSDGKTVIAYQGGTFDNKSSTIYLTTSSSPDLSNTWDLQSVLDAEQRTSLGLLGNADGIILSYTTAYSSDALELRELDWSTSNQSWDTSGLPQIGLGGLDASTTGMLSVESTQGDFILLSGINGSDGNAIELSMAGISGGNAGLRLISGAPSGAAFIAANDAASPEQSIQLSSFVPGLAPRVALNRASDNTLRLIGQSVTTGDVYSVESVNLDSTSVRANSLQSAEQLFPTSSGGLNDWSISWHSASESNSSLNTATDFGDLNGDGILDYLDTSGNTQIEAENISFDLWSIRAAGDVNGNGVDDVLLSLAPQGPAYVPSANGDPSSLMAVLVDGSLFEVDINHTTGASTFSLSSLKTPLNPYNRAELYDITSTSNSLYQPSLQNWIDPILNFQPGQLTSVQTDDTTGVDSAESFSPPAVVVSPEGTSYLFYSGADTSGIQGASGLWMSYQSDGQNWQQLGAIPAASTINNTSPSATFFKGKLYVAFTDVNQYVNIAVCDGDPTELSNWSSYIVTTSTEESTGYSPTLVAEGERLGLYFPSNNPIKADQELSDTYQYIRYLYSNDPSDVANFGNWGSQLGSDGQYSGLSGQLDHEITSPIAATLFNGNVVLAYRSSDSGFGFNTRNGTIQLLTSSGSQPSLTDPHRSYEWIPKDTGVSNVNGVGLATDQSLLYLTTSHAWNSGKPQSWMWSMQPSDDSGSPWTLNQQLTIDNVSLKNNNQAFYVDFYADYNNATIVPYIDNGVLKAVWADGNSSLQVANLLTSVTAPTQSSLAGYSVDGNIDINGDGFFDILISDPSDPSESVNNQYALFGGDYLNIANQVGTEADDTLVGTPLSDVIYSLSGSDVVLSKGGHDVILTGASDDSVSIVDGSFIRIDTGSGFDKLQLEGNANQAYNFSAANGTPEYFVGTKLRNVELINSSYYGANILSFDPAAVSSFNKDRVLFVTPDENDSLYLYSDETYEFARSTSYDTSFAGVVWNAYASQRINDGAIVNPTLLYVLNPAANDNTWLDKHVLINPGTPAPNSTTATLLTSDTSELPRSSAVDSQQSFGNGLTLTAYKFSSTASVALFELTRTQSDIAQVVAYASSSVNGTAEPGRDYTAIGGVIRFEPGETSQLITVPLNSLSIHQLRNAALSLQLEELQDLNQQAIHLLIDPTTPNTGQDSLPPTLSSFQLTASSKPSSAILSFRADINDKQSSQDSLKLDISERESASADVSSVPQTVSIAEFTQSNEVETVIDELTGSVRLDNDFKTNAQVSARLRLNLDSNSSEPRVELLGKDLETLSPFTLTSSTSFTLQNDAPLTVWRSDSSAGVLQLSLVSSDGKEINLLANALSAQNGAMSSDIISGDNWIATEGKAIGSRIAISSASISQQDLSFSALLDGHALELQDIVITGNELTASFTDGITAHLNLGSTPTTPSQQPIVPSVTVSRLGGYNNHLAFYAVDDLTGTVDGLAPSDSGYLDAALARAKTSNLYLDADQLPGYAQSASFSDLKINPNRQYGLLCIVNGNTDTIYSSFSAANPNGAVQMIAIDSAQTPSATTIAIEDLAFNPNNPTSSDYNDLIVTIAHSHAIAIL